MRTNVAVILAAGSGKRFGADIPKQFVKVNGRMVLEYTIDAFQQHADIDEIALVLHPSYMELMQSVINQNHWAKVRKILPGGNERYKTTLAAINAYANQDVNLIIHDGVRALVSQDIIGRVTSALQLHEAVAVAIPVTDTIYEMSAGKVHRIPDRNQLYRAQTPQAFRCALLQKAFQIGMQSADFHVTDDCSVVHRYMPEAAIYMVAGEERNIKLTFPSDLEILERQQKN